MGYDKPAQNAKPGDKVGWDYKDGRAAGKVVKVKPTGERVIKGKYGQLRKKQESDLYKK